MMDGYDMGTGSWIGMTVVAVCAVVIACVLVWVVASRGSADPRVSERSARAVLDARLAEGKIDTAEYRQRLEALSVDREES